MDNSVFVTLFTNIVVLFFNKYIIYSLYYAEGVHSDEIKPTAQDSNYL